MTEIEFGGPLQSRRRVPLENNDTFVICRRDGYFLFKNQIVNLIRVINYLSYLFYFLRFILHFTSLW